MLIANIWVPKKMTSNSLAVKLVINFITVPVYIFMIFWFESGLEDLRYVFDKSSTVEEPVMFSDKTVCVSKDMGNIEQWAQIEILTFYCNIAIMVVYLIYTRIFYRTSAVQKEEPKKDEEQKQDGEPLLQKQETKVTSVNQSIVTESDIAGDKKSEEHDPIDESRKANFDKALDSVHHDADLLRSIESERQFGKMQFLCILISFFIIRFQASENVDAEEDINVLGGYTYQYMALDLEYKIKRNMLGWSAEKQTIDGSKNLWIIFLLMTVHFVSYFIGKYIIGTKRYSTKKEQEEFPKKFRILFVILLAVNIGCAAVCVPHNLINDKGMGQYFHLWIHTDCLILFLIQFNIYSEYIYVQRYDQMLAEYILELVQNQEELDRQARPSQKEKMKETRAKLNLQNDIYSITYYQYHAHESPISNGDLLIKCLLAVVIQCLIIFYRFKEVYDNQPEITVGLPYMNSVRLACAFFMHLQLYPELEISLGMIRYGLYNSENFKAKATIPMILSLFKITGAMVATIGSAYMICQAKTCSQCLIFFMGMSIVANIDNLMALTVTDSAIVNEMSSDPIYFNKM